MKRRAFIQKATIFSSLSIIPEFSLFSNDLPTKTNSVKKLSVSVTNDYLMCDGQPFFYLADTSWSAFTNPTEEEWAYYLEFRRKQGFNALQINTLPQGDRSENIWNNPMPFAIDCNGKRIFSNPDDQYFDRAARLLEMAVDKGFVPALVVFWGDLAPGTWLNKMFNSQIIPKEEIRPYVNYLVQKFARFEPIWIISGDSDLPEESKEWYKIARDTIKELRPEQLVTFHLSPEAPLPEDWTDIYMTYTGHDYKQLDQNYKQAADRSGRKIKHPVISGEPCYEAHGSGPEYRFSQSDIRKALWWGLLSGAKAGFTYGAHGVWCWHRTGQKFGNTNWAQNPLDWRVALTLPGADDAALAKQLYEQYSFHKLSPKQELLLEMPEQVRISASADNSSFVIYAAYSIDVKVNLQLKEYEVKMLNLSTKQYLNPAIKHEAGKSTIEMIQSNTDVAIFGNKF